ncbi:MAG: hypothetical protein LBK00_00365 [Treponema sp.]|jgi:hypothetical protein|nr:hypothetical protein [Treponema sp.]
MSDGKTKDITFLAAWIALIVLLGGVLWLFTQNLRYSCLLKSVNTALESVGDTQRLERIPSNLSKHNSLGFWYYEESSQNRAFVFSIMDDGILQPCLAWVSPEGSVIEIFFLQRNVRDVTRFSQGIINVYKQRIEQSVLPALKQVPAIESVAEPLEIENEEEP